MQCPTKLLFIIRVLIILLIVGIVSFMAIFLGISYPKDCYGDMPKVYPKRILIVQHQTLSTYRDIAFKIRFNPDIRFLLNVLSIQTNLE